ncbi:MAG: hypothetical protein CO141_04185 [Candidatus Moranbacteria bacterium CG_4_9_14_3_um_filter_42_9]|nr:MAG: hypothetical protein CO141_04185 [Candidatus Moranbacteria bacterium CG_4_9_14_3_um_filter_42_9]
MIRRLFFVVIIVLAIVVFVSGVIDYATSGGVVSLVTGYPRCAEALNSVQGANGFPTCAVDGWVAHFTYWGKISKSTFDSTAYRVVSNSYRIRNAYVSDEEWVYVYFEEAGARQVPKFWKTYYLIADKP